MTDPPFTIRIRSENNEDMDWMVKPDQVTFLQTLVSKIINTNFSEGYNFKGYLFCQSQPDFAIMD